MSNSAPIDLRTRPSHRHGERASSRREKGEYASKNFYDIWLPTLAPSAEQSSCTRARRASGNGAIHEEIRAEMASPGNRATLDLLALSPIKPTSPSVAIAARITLPSSVLRALLLARGAR